MSGPATCKHDGLYWYAAPANEQGWKCSDCGWQPGEPPGFSPQHDRSHLRVKVSCIVMTLHESEVIYVSNSECGEGMTDLITKRCRERGWYNSVSIARAVLEFEGDSDHVRFWREISEGILAGKDPRARCACGQLATVFSIGPNGKHQLCSDCWSEPW